MDIENVEASDKNKMVLHQKLHLSYWLPKSLKTSFLSMITIPNFEDTRFYESLALFRSMELIPKNWHFQNYTEAPSRKPRLYS